MGQVALAQEPLQVAIRYRAQAVTAQRRMLAAVTARIGLVALRAVVAEETRTGSDSAGIARKRIGPRVVLGRNTIPVGTRGRQRQRAA